MCGENVTIILDGQQGEGSSPRVRGKRPRRPLPFRRHGLIPACAGKTLAHNTAHARGRAHPRVCGENFLCFGLRGGHWGSSPRVRGKHAAYAQSRGNSGLIPACAGKTTRTQTTWCSPSAHPRVCGENTGLPVGSASPSGSSPRVRGKRRNRSRAQRVHGLIPACAGKTRVSS